MANGLKGTVSQRTGGCVKNALFRLQNSLHRHPKRLILLLRPLGRPFQMLAGTKELFIVMTLFEQPFRVIRRVFQPVLIERAHGGTGTWQRVRNPA